MANALFRLAVGELQESDIAQAIDQPLVPVDFGVAPPQWLVLWGVAWDHAPLPEETHRAVFSPPPTGRTAERTRKGRWQQAAQHELKSMLYNEWAELGTLPVVYHRSQ